ncbi:MAG: histidine kinase N-terminal 7TM domain-containing protein, partial [Spirochaetales bacterium]|nr:histidine kinase N-terminal 7TM domain-containing protein [Spirochaetales bacterium]
MEYYLYLIITPIAFAIVFITIAITWKYRQEALGSSLLVYFFLIMLFLMTNVFELVAGKEFWLLVWTKAQITLYSFIPVVWIVFSVRFSKIEITSSIHVYKRIILVVPVLTTLLVWTYPLHKLFYSSHEIVSISGFSTLNTKNSFFFWIFGAHSYLLLIIGAIFISRQLLARGQLFQRLSVIIFLGSIFPLAANILFILPLPFFIFKDYTPIAFAVSGLFFFIGIYWHRFLEIIPIARNIVVEEMDQGVVIMDKSDRIIDINHSAREILGIKRNILGEELQSVEEIWPNIKHSYKKEDCLFETMVGNGVDVKQCNIRVKPICLDQQEQSG